MTKNISIGLSWVTGHLDMFIALVLSYFLGSILLRFDSSFIVAGLALFILLLVFLNYPRIYVYFIICIYPFTGLISKFTGGTILGGGYSSINIGGMITILGLLYGVFYIIIKRPRIFDYELGLPFAIFLLIVLISIIYTPLKLMAFRQWARYASQFVLYLIILDNFTSPKDAKKLLNLLMILFIIIGFYFLLSIYFPSLRGDIMRNIRWNYEEMELASDFTMYRLTGFQHSVDIGTSIVFYFALALFHFYESPATRRLKYVPLFVLMLILLFNTLARNAWISFTFVMFVIGIFRFRLFMMVGFFAAISALVVFPSVMDIILLRMQPDPAALARITQLEQAWTLFLQRPLMGWGQAYFQYWDAIRTGAGFKYGGIVGGSSHVAYFRVLAELGILGLMAQFYYYFRGYKLTYKLFRSPHQTARNYSIVTFATLTGIFMSGLSGQGFANLAYYFWVFIAIGEVYYRSLGDPEEER